MPDEPFDAYVVVVNDEEQYSVWPAAKPMPDGWRAVGEPRTREECIAYVDEAWLDMRPRSLREAHRRLS